MRIAIVHSFYRDGPSGENFAVELQANALAEAGHEVRVISRSTQAYLDRPGYALTSGLVVATGLGPSPLREINEFDADIVHVHNLFPNWGDRWIDSLERPLVASIHNFRPVCAAGTLTLNGSSCDLCPTKGSHQAVKNRCYQGSAFKSIPLALATRHPSSNRILMHAAAVIFLAEETRRKFTKFLHGSLGNRTSVIPNFVAPRAESPPPVTLKRRAQFWLFAGRLSSEKGIIQLIEAWPENVRLVIAGSGPLAQEARRAAEDKEVDFLGQVGPDEVAKLMGQAKGLVFPSITGENSPLSLIEAFGHGLPVVAKSGNAAADLVQRHDAGRVFAYFSELPRALEEAEASRLNLGTNARALFEQNFSKSRWLRQTLGLYEGLLSP